MSNAVSGSRSGFLKYSLPLLLAFLAITYLSVIGRFAFVGADEPRYARIAQEMLARGDWVVPTLNGVPWMEKPPLLYWAVMISYRFLGVSEFAARLPSVLGALATVAILFWAVRRIAGERAAFFSALILGSSLGFTGFGCAATTDMLLTACVAAGLLALWESLRQAPAGSAWLMGAACLAFGLGTLAKGPLAMVIPILAVLPCLTLRGGFDRLWKPRLAAGLLIFLACALPWYYLMYRREGFYFILVFFINHHLARFFTDIHHHANPFWFYLPVLALGLLPWSLFLPGAARLRRRLRGKDPSQWDENLVFLLCWIVFPFLFFSLSSAKLPGYVLPLFPPLAVIIALGLESYFDRRNPLHPLQKIVPVLLMAGGTAALGFFFGYRYQLPWLGLLLGLLLAPGVALFLYFRIREQRERAVAALALCLFLPATAGGPVLLPRLEPFHSNRYLCQAANPLTGPNNPLIIFRNFHHTNNYYTDYRCTDNFVSLADLMAYLKDHPSPAYLLTEEEGWEDLKRIEAWKLKVIDRAGRCRLVKMERYY